MLIDTHDNTSLSPETAGRKGLHVEQEVLFQQSGFLLVVAWSQHHFRKSGPSFGNSAQTIAYSESFFNPA